MTEQEIKNVNDMCMALKNYVDTVATEENEHYGSCIGVAGMFLLAAQQRDETGYMFTEEDIVNTAGDAIRSVLCSPGATMVRVRKKPT